MNQRKVFNFFGKAKLEACIDLTRVIQMDPKDTESKKLLEEQKVKAAEREKQKPKQEKKIEVQDLLKELP